MFVYLKKSEKSLSVCEQRTCGGKKNRFRLYVKTLFCTRQNVSCCRPHSIRFKGKPVLCRRNFSADGSFTVEAAMAAPLFLFFLALFLGLFRVMMVEIQVNEALQYAAGKVAEYIWDEEEDAAGEVLSLVSADALFYEKLEDGGCQSEWLKNGFIGISVGTAESDDLFVNVTADYEIRLPVAYFGLQYVEVSQHASARKWNGWQDGLYGDGEEEWVYITPYGTVYHESTSCSYLDLSVQAVSLSEVDGLRNKSGGIYYACSRCGAEDASGTVYVTDYGTEYHASLNCSSLKRTVYRVALSEVGDRSACSKCCGD